MPKPVLMPSLSSNMTEGKLIRWLKRDGEAVRKGEPLAEVETDKAVLEVEALHSGRLQILASAGGDAIPINQAIGYLLEEGEQLTYPEQARPLTARADTAAAERRDESVSTSARPAAGSGGRHHASPRARRLARERGIGLDHLAGSGSSGRIVARDLEQVGTRAKRTAIPNSPARQIAAKRLVEAKTSIPHFYTSIDCEVDALMSLRSRLNESATDAPRTSLNDLLVRACALALRRVPRVNATWSEDAVYQLSEVDIAVAVASDDGVMTPIVRHADRKSVAQISTEIRDLAERTRNRRLRPDEYQGGSFTISNLGMYGVKEFAAIINPPHAAILAAGAAELRPVVRDNTLAIATLMSMTLSCDHRLVEGVDAARFLGELKSLVEKPGVLAEAASETGP